MKDRDVQFPNRYRLVRVSGTDGEYDLIPSPGTVTEEGDYINKANLLPDEVVRSLGLKQENPQVKDALLRIKSLMQLDSYKMFNQAKFY